MLLIRAEYSTNKNIVSVDWDDDVKQNVKKFMDRMKQIYTEDMSRIVNIFNAAIDIAISRGNDAATAAAPAAPAAPTVAASALKDAAITAGISKTILNTMLIVFDSEPTNNYVSVINFIYEWSKNAFDRTAPSIRGGRMLSRGGRMRGGDDSMINISNTGDLISSVGPPANYANSAYLSVLQNTPLASPAETTVSQNPAYNFYNANDTGYIDRQISAGAKVKSKKDKGLKDKKVKKRSIIYQ